MKIKKIYLPILVFSAIAFGVLLGSKLNFPVASNSFSNYEHRDKLNKILDFIEKEYVDDVDKDSIISNTLNGILSGLDPHSIYFPPAEQEEIDTEMQGNFVGIGINYYVFHDTLAVIKPVIGGPSEKAGILAGDRILYVDKIKIFGKKFASDSIIRKLRGEENSLVKLTIYRKNTKQYLSCTLKRKPIPVPSLAMALKVSPRLGYIKLDRFSETTADEFKTALQKLKKQGITSLVIDLRDNGGGYMEKAIEVIDELLKENQLIVFTKNKRNKVDKTYASSGGLFENGKLYVLINENSASASEILAGAVQDNDRGIIIGRRSFGKGLVQEEMNFEDGSAVRLTVARYFTPSGRSIQKPYKRGEDDYFSDFDKRVLNGELHQKDSIKVNDSLKFKTTKGKIVYGGGGIVPDVFVPMEVAQGNENTAYLMQSGMVSFFVFEQIEKNRTYWKGLSQQELTLKLKTTKSLVSEFQVFLDKSNIKVNLLQNSAFVTKYLEAEFAKQLFGDAVYYQMLLKDDSMMQSVLKTEAQP